MSQLGGNKKENRMKGMTKNGMTKNGMTKVI